MEVKSKIKIVFSVRNKNIPGWPFISYDYDKESKKIIEQLEFKFPNIEFKPEYYYSEEKAKEGFADNKEYDGIVIFNLAHGTGVPRAFLERKEAGVIVDGLFGGSGDSIRAHHKIKKEKLPVITVLSSDFQNVVDAVELLTVKRKINNSKVLVFKNFGPIPKEKEELIKESVGTGSTWQRFLSGRKGMEEKLNLLKERYGVDVTIGTKDDLLSYYNNTDNNKATKIAEKWIQEAQSIVEPTKDEILKSARMYLALKTAVEDHKVDAISIDCIMMYFTGQLSAYPCLSHFQMNNDGFVGVCESDLDAILTQLVIKYVTGRPGFVSDPVIDTASNQIIYAHCMASNKPLGTKGPVAPYIIRSHAEDNKGASVQVIKPLGYTVTTIKFDILTNSMSIHNGKAVGNVNSPLACRTKLAVEVPDAQLLLDNWDTDIFSWHKVTVYGNYRKQFMNLAKLYRMNIFGEDKK